MQPIAIKLGTHTGNRSEIIRSEFHSSPLPLTLSVPEVPVAFERALYLRRVGGSRRGCNADCIPRAENTATVEMGEGYFITSRPDNAECALLRAARAACVIMRVDGG